MKFSTREDIEAPIEHVFARLTDFDNFEKQALRRGAEVQRLDGDGPVGTGAEWFLKFRYRGKMREVHARISEFQPPNGYWAETRSGGLHGLLTIDLVPLSPRRTRLHVTMDLKPGNLQARLLVQSLKFAKANLSKRFAARIESYARVIEDKYRQTA